MESDDQEYVESGSGVMVSNLPLLFSWGSPSSLHEMSLAELEVFVPFMVRCSIGEERLVPWAQLPRPTWWPKKRPFRMPTASNTIATRAALVDLVERCYSFHGCEYLLQFCASLVSQMPVSGYRFNDNRDGTTSMYHGTTGKLLVTFRNENRESWAFNFKPGQVKTINFDHVDETPELHDMRICSHVLHLTLVVPQPLK